MNWYRKSQKEDQEDSTNQIVSIEKKLQLWIKALVDKKYGGPEKAVEGWCGEVAGDIYRYLKSQGENPEIWSVVDWNKYKGQPNVISNPTSEDHQNVLDEITGCFTHSYVKWNNMLWDGSGLTTLKKILQNHSWGSLGNGTSIMREH